MTFPWPKTPLLAPHPQALAHSKNHNNSHNSHNSHNSNNSNNSNNNKGIFRHRSLPTPPTSPNSPTWPTHPYPPSSRQHSRLLSHRERPPVHPPEAGLEAAPQVGVRRPSHVASR